MYVLRRLEGSDYELFYPLINEFRETHFTKEEFEETLTQMKHYSDIWTVEYNSELIGTATIIY
jgi:hypothetical protein